VDIEVRTEVLFEFFKGRYAVGMAAWEKDYKANF
jgi:hypothetical protein